MVALIEKNSAYTKGQEQTSYGYGSSKVVFIHFIASLFFFFFYVSSSELGTETTSRIYAATIERQCIVCIFFEIYAQGGPHRRAANAISCFFCSEKHSKGRLFTT